MRDFFCFPLFRCLICLILVCCILVNLSPVRAEALPISTWVWLEASMVFASLFAGLGVSPVDELAAGFRETCDACWDFISLNYDFVTDDEKIAVWATGTDELPFMIDQELVEAVRDWLFTSETIVEDEAASGMAYYNNWYLPVLPGLKYPELWGDSPIYSFIDYLPDSETFVLVYYSNVRTVSVSSSGTYTLYLKDSRREQFNYTLSDSSWVYADRSSSSNSGQRIYSMVWSDNDLYLDDGSLFIAGSEPSSTQTITAEDYLTLGYVAPSSEDFTTGYSTWASGAISVPGIRSKEEAEELVVPLSIPGTAGFTCVLRDEGSDIYLYRESSTDVLYMWKKAYYAGGLSVMLHPDGTPLLYSEWKEMKEVTP